MDTVFVFVQEHAQYAHWIFFGLLMLAGLNFPISEDVIIILGGVLASNFVPENTWKIFLAIFLGAYISDWVVYWIGRVWGPNLWKIRWFSRFLQPAKLIQISGYYARYGVLTLLVGRFIPFGVRNCLFATAGIGRMHFGKFLISDGIACFLSNSSLFIFAYFCGKNCSSLVNYVNIVIFCVFLIAMAVFIWYRKTKVVSPLE